MLDLLSLSLIFVTFSQILFNVFVSFWFNFSSFLFLRRHYLLCLLTLAFLLVSFSFLIFSLISNFFCHVSFFTLSFLNCKMRKVVDTSLGLGDSRENHRCESSWCITDTPSPFPSFHLKLCYLVFVQSKLIVVFLQRILLSLLSSSFVIVVIAVAITDFIALGWKGN